MVWNGRSWTLLPPPGNLDIVGVTTTGPDVIEVLTEDSMRWLFDGTNWLARGHADWHLFHGWGGVKTDSFHSNDREVQRWNGPPLFALKGLPSGPVHGLWGRTDAFTAGAGGAISEFDGERWNTWRVGTSNWSAAWSPGRDSVFVAGGRGAVIELRASADCPAPRGVSFTPREVSPVRP
jgi:hypothetical protein